MTRSALPFFLLAAFGVTAAFACSSTTTVVAQKDGGATDAATDGNGNAGDGAVGYPAPHPAMPQAVKLAGAVMSAPKAVSISFMGDSLQSGVDTFVSQVAAATAYWNGAVAEYGVGPLTALPPQHIATAPTSPLTDADVQAFLTTQINAGGGFPQPDANTIYTIFYPANFVVTMGGGSLCAAFEGYHGAYAITPGNYVTYAVVGRCPPPVAGVTPLDEVSAEASHELIEAATDPLPDTAPAWINVDADHQGWALVGGGSELGDLCAPFPDTFFKPTGIDNLVTGVWSNAAAAAGHDPCEPQGTSPVFNSAPVLTDSITVSGSPVGTFITKGVKIPVGSSQTVELDLYSDAPTSGPWKLSVLDLTSAFFGGAAALDMTLDQTTGQNGDKVNLTIKALSKSSLGASPFWVQNDLGNRTTVWIGLVGN